LNGFRHSAKDRSGLQMCRVRHVQPGMS
jgi:hypothetical protein